MPYIRDRHSLLRLKIPMQQMSPDSRLQLVNPYTSSHRNRDHLTMRQLAGSINHALRLHSVNQVHFVDDYEVFGLAQRLAFNLVHCPKQLLGIEYMQDKIRITLCRLGSLHPFLFHDVNRLAETRGVD